MNSKLKQMAVSFLIMITVNFALSTNLLWKLGLASPHVGLLFVLGLLFGPYGALGAVSANIILDVLNGYTPIQIIPSAIFSFAVSYLAYKLWYSGFKTDKITKPRLDNIYHLVLFMSGIVICGLVYSTAHGNLIGIFLGSGIDQFYFITYLLNFINIGFIFGILSIWLSKKIDFIQTPKISEKPVNKKLYQAIFSLLLITTAISSLLLIFDQPKNIQIALTVLIGVLLIAYLTKPVTHEIQPSEENTIIETIIQNFLIITLTIAIIGMLISFLSYNFVTNLNNINLYVHLMPTLIITDAIIILFFIPGIIILRYIENKVIKPISSFSKIERFISENEKIESEGLLNIYSEYINEKNEIGTLARSYSELIQHNNNHIENIRKIEGEKERINAELDIATRIQAAALPTETLENDYFRVNGFSHPAKEVGGDFFDYYMIDDENLAIVIGDASGKGVPAALLAMITQVTIKQMLKYDKDPSKILYLLNNQLYENNSETMFLTLWLGIYNKTTKKITYSNAGHNPPLLRENNAFKYLNINSGIVLGIVEDFDYVSEEITLTDELVLYTDGITDANNINDETYGEKRLLKLLNGLESYANPIEPLLNDIQNFSGDAEQFDDMTLLYLMIK